MEKHGKKLEALEESPKTKITLKKHKIKENATPGWYKSIMIYRFPSSSNRSSIEMNRGLQETNILEWMAKEKHPDLKLPTKRKYPKQFQIHNMPTNDVENSNGTVRWGYLQFTNKLRNVTRRTERMLQCKRRARDLQYNNQGQQKRQKNLAMA